VLKTGEAHASALLEVMVEIAPKAPAQSTYEAEQPSVRAVLEQDPVEVVVELDAAGDVAASLLQPTDDVGQAVEALGARIGGLVKCQRLEGGEDRPDLKELRRVERGQAEASPGVGGEQALTGETEQGFADRGAAYAEFGGDGGVAELGASRNGTSLNTLQDLEIHLFA
jgi:hypothetical protein